MSEVVVIATEVTGIEAVGTATEVAGIEAVVTATEVGIAVIATGIVEIVSVLTGTNPVKETIMGTAESATSASADLEARAPIRRVRIKVAEPPRAPRILKMVINLAEEP